MQADVTAAGSGPTDFLLPAITGRPRVALWALLLALTAVLILYPANLKYEYSIHAIPFVYVFDNLGIFATLYYSWLLALFVLLFTRGAGEKVEWEKAALVGIFALVFTGYSTFMSRGLVGDAFAPAGDIKNLMAQGQFFDAPSLKYNGFPGFALLGTGVGLVTGMDTTDYMAFFPFLQILIFAAMFYLFLSRLLKNPYFASLGVILIIQADLSISTSLPQFHGGVFAPYFLLAAALLLMAIGRTADGRRWYRPDAGEALMLVVLAALYISHFVTSVVVLLTVLGIYVIQKISHKNVLSIPLVAVLLLAPVIWNISENLVILKYFVTLVPPAFESLTSGDIINTSLLPLETNSYIGARALWWMSPSLFLGPLLIIVIGGILGLARLFKIRRLEGEEVISLGGLVGVVVLAFALLFLRGLQESYGRTLLYIALFTVPIILWRVFRLGRLRKYAFALLAAAMLLLSLPWFLLSSKAIAGMTYYPSEVASGEFLEAGFGRGAGMHVYGVGGSAYYVNYYLPDAFMNYAYVPDLRSKSEKEIWRRVNEYVSGVENAGVENMDEQAVAGILMFSPKWDAPFRDYIGSDVKDSPAWRQLESRLAENDLIYANSFVRVYYLSPVSGGQAR